MPIKTEADENEDSYDAESNANHRSKLPGGSLRAGGRSESPLAEKILDAHAEMERRAQNADREKCQIERVLKISSDRVVGGFAASHQPLGVNVPGNECERHESGVALQGVHPVPDPRI